MFFAFAACLQAGEFEGVYRSGADGKAADRLYTIKKVGDDKYTVTTNDWVSTVYYDKHQDDYKGVFRFNDFPPVAGNEFTKGGARENAVGFHIYEITEDGGIKVIFQWRRAARDGQGTFKLVKVK
ncbi:hypothetical protein FEM03_11445 [Phragmitibacter flavus]|uniref:Uncharacterized protein n=1 Tax=Phragmitibacter flavus TaxID=2576071 RepID=A0A5R8KF33_9BACT|nr:hypothetical protein [Phragmitibacter flavus]TLD70910.1 hypothetical protein FEM03_11445 [Phragmitibacter flavus]